MSILDITEHNCLSAVKYYLDEAVGITTALGQDNYVPELPDDDFIVATSLNVMRMGTNSHKDRDALFVGSISGDTLTITSVYPDFDKPILIGLKVYGVGVAANTRVIKFLTGSGGIGNYQINNTQTLTSRDLAISATEITQPTEWSVQLDVHGSNSRDNCLKITATFNDQYGVSLFKDSGFNVSPLYATEPHQVPFQNAEQQIENRWVFDLHMQYNPTITAPAQYFESVTADTKQL